MATLCAATVLYNRIFQNKSSQPMDNHFSDVTLQLLGGLEMEIRVPKRGQLISIYLFPVFLLLLIFNLCIIAMSWFYCSLMNCLQLQILK